MKEIKIKMSDNTKEKLKEYAKRDYRSLSSYIELYIAYIASQEYTPAPTVVSHPEMISYQHNLEKKGE